MIDNTDHIFSKLKFSNNWFEEASGDIFRVIKEHFNIKSKLSILELGTYEGQSTISLAHNICINDKSSITSIDVCTNDIVKHNMDLLPSQLQKKIHLINEKSSDALKKLTNHYDIIYIDASHFPDDVLEDSVLAFKLLKQNGLLIFDDYMFDNINYLNYIDEDSINRYKSLYQVHPHSILKLPHRNTLFMKDVIDLFGLIYSPRLTKLGMENPQTACFKKVQESFHNTCIYNQTLPMFDENNNSILNKLSKDEYTNLCSTGQYEKINKDEINYKKQYISKKSNVQSIANVIFEPHDDINTFKDTNTFNTINTIPSKPYAIFCPFYISDDNQGKWIENWINTTQKETAPKYYTISYPKNFDITKYSAILDKLNSVATCIGSSKYMYHTDALKIAHEYLMTNYSYMVHIEQDVILKEPIANHLVNTIIKDDNDVLITDIKANLYFDIPSDIDVSVFVLKLSSYDSSNYYTYTNVPIYKSEKIVDYKNKYNLGNTDKLHTLFDNVDTLNIHNAMNDIIQHVYKSTKNKHWVYITLNELGIEMDAPIYIDSARAYPLHAYMNNKLSVVYGITHKAKHLKQSRSLKNSNIMSSNEIIKWCGYPPIGENSPNSNIEITPHTYNGIDVVIISKNQCDSLKTMLETLKFDLPNANRIFVLDRCTDGSKEFLESNNEFFIEREDAIGFCAGSARNLGLKYTDPSHDVLFLDGDRIPHNLSHERIIQMLHYFDISMIKNEHDIRNWFVNVPSININMDKFNNNVWSSAILLKRSSIDAISSIVGEGNVFDPIFDGHWGCEDEYVGDIAKYFGMTVGGFPNFIYVEGTTTDANCTTPSYIQQVEKRKQRIENLHTVQSNDSRYMNRYERRSHVENFLKHRERLGQ